MTSECRCVRTLNMKTATVRQIQHHFNEVLAWVNQGTEVCVTRRRQAVAMLVPLVKTPRRRPDFLGRAEVIWGKGASRQPLSRMVIKARGD